MDIEHLTKMQIVLLTLLVSFVTSIATGIITVTLMNQVPPAVTQTLNRVVERTVERVVPDKSQGASVITKEVTIVVKEDDLITDSIGKNLKSIVKITKKTEEGIAGNLLGLGVIVSNNGIIMTDLSVTKDNSTFIIETEDGHLFNANIIETENKKQVSFIFIEKSEDDKDGKDSKGNIQETLFSPIAFPDANTLKLGQTVISITGGKRTNVSVGIISGFIEDNIEKANQSLDTDILNEKAANDAKDISQETIKTSSIIKTNIDKNNIIAGSPLTDMFGKIIGIATTDLFMESSAVFISVADVKNILLDINLVNTETTKIKKQ